MHHVGISCTDIERSLHFYRDVLGLEECGVGMSWTAEDPAPARIAGLPVTAGSLVMLRANNAFIELFQFQHPDPGPAQSGRPVSQTGITHVGFEVDDVVELHRRLRAAGVAFTTAPLDLGDGSLATYGRDPDDNVFEIVELKSEEARLISVGLATRHPQRLGHRSLVGLALTHLLYDRRARKREATESVAPAVAPAPAAE